MTKQWRPVVGFEDLYEVSNFGLVRSLDRYVRSRGGRRLARGKILKPQRHSGGYLQVSLSCRVHLIHEIVAAAFIGPRPPGLEVCHGNGVKTDNRDINLRYDTHVANCTDRKSHGFVVEGARNPQAKLTEADVRAVRAASGRQRDIASRFGIAQGHVSRIRRKDRWSHVT